MNHFSLHAALKAKFLIFHIHAPSVKTKTKHIIILYKQEKAKRKVKNSAAVFVDVPVLAA